MVYDIFFIQEFLETWKLFQGFHKGKKVEKCWSTVLKEQSELEIIQALGEDWTHILFASEKPGETYQLIYVSYIGKIPKLTFKTLSFFKISFSGYFFNLKNTFLKIWH